MERLILTCIIAYGMIVFLWKFEYIYYPASATRSNQPATV